LPLAPRQIQRWRRKFGGILGARVGRLCPTLIVPANRTSGRVDAEDGPIDLRDVPIQISNCSALDPETTLDLCGSVSEDEIYWGRYQA
jgi:hypothetical protein